MSWGKEINVRLTEHFISFSQFLSLFHNEFNNSIKHEPILFITWH